MSASSTRVWVLYVWTERANPEGVDAIAGRAFSLAVGGEAFLSRTLITGDTNPHVEQALLEARHVADGVRTRAVHSGQVAAEHAMLLRASWLALADRVTAELGSSVSSVFAVQHRAQHPVGKLRDNGASGTPPLP